MVEKICWPDGFSSDAELSSPHWHTLVGTSWWISSSPREGEFHQGGDNIINTSSLLIAKFSDKNLNLAVHICSIHCWPDYNSLICLRVSFALQNMHIAKPISLFNDRFLPAKTTNLIKTWLKYTRKNTRIKCKFSWLTQERRHFTSFCSVVFQYKLWISLISFPTIFITLNEFKLVGLLPV